MAYRIIVDREACIGCGNCAAVCPSYFKIVAGKAEAIKKEIAGAGCAQEAADSCPVSAISIKKSK